MTLAQLTELLGWVSVINFCILIVVFVMLTVFRNIILSMHSNMFAIKESDLLLIYFKFMANYKTLILIFNVVPYFALKIMGN
jgi:uncharacterized protein DUF6868